MFNNIFPKIVQFVK